ncbi:MAG: hypothetical protein EAX96_11055 [Candidatus Lokiarchaeota archaeon]|nr:hypothetical protein [Candidatus Lokiarchaeota archaeon]
MRRKMMDKISVAFMQLGSCWGCHQSLLDLHEEILDILPLIDIKFWQAVVDTKEKDLEAMPDKSIEVGFVEGHIRTEHDVHSLKLMRKKSKTLVCWGACACNGGIPSLANSFPIEENVKRKYVTADTVVTSNPITENLPAFVDKIIPNDEIVQVDAYLYGCPPKRENIKAAIFGVVEALYGQLWLDTNVCSVCEMKGAECLLRKSIPCFGSVTGAPPGLKWTKDKGPCMGEYGMTKNISMEEATILTNFVDGLTQVTPAVAKIIIEFVTLYFRLPALGSLVLPIDPLQAVAQGKLGEYPLERLAGGGDGLALDVPEPIRNFAVIALKKLASANIPSGIQNVCAHCERNKDIKIVGYKRDHEGKADPKVCFLNQGYMCMGFLTNAGCGATCPGVNMPCAGCYGPTPDIVSNPEAFIKKITDLGGNPDILKDTRGLFYRFSYAKTKHSGRLDK